MQTRYYVSFQGLIKDPWKWRVIRVAEDRQPDGSIRLRHRVYWRVQTQREANDLAAFLTSMADTRITGRPIPPPQPGPIDEPLIEPVRFAGLAHGDDPTARSGG